MHVCKIFFAQQYFSGQFPHTSVLMCSHVCRTVSYMLYQGFQTFSCTFSCFFHDFLHIEPGCSKSELISNPYLELLTPPVIKVPDFS